MTTTPPTGPLFYVAALRGRCAALLLGPFTTHAAAHASIPGARDLARFNPDPDLPAGRFAVRTLRARPGTPPPMGLWTAPQRALARQPFAAAAAR